MAMAAAAPMLLGLAKDPGVQKTARTMSMSIAIVIGIIILAIIGAIVAIVVSLKKKDTSKKGKRGKRHRR